jgi:two-component system response regulator HydG
VDVRILAATNVDLRQAVREGKFREDLYYRLNVITIDLPPLRTRREDIPLLAASFLKRYAEENDLAPRTLAPEAMRVLMDYDWPGNVRELENAVEHGATMTSGGEIQLGHLPTQLQQKSLAALHAANSAGRKKDEASEAEEIIPLAVQERHAILDAIRVTHGDKLRAARLLDIGKTTLYRKLKEYGIADPAREN